MRIERLDLLRYGALTDRQLSFRPDAALHVVHGPNEAGKSSSLASISDLLFGFEHNVSHAFLHDAPTLRVGARLRSAAGEGLAFRRRRGRQNTLLADGDDETPLRDDALAPFLGGLTRTIFERAFGLDSQRLREGSNDMLSAGGEVGTLLFAASSGILGLSDLRRTLDEEAGRIFAPRASATRSFYQLLKRHDDARRDERDRELRAADWKALNQEIDRLGEDHAEAVRARAENRRRQAAIERLTRLLPVVKEIEREGRALAAFDDLAAWPEGLGHRLREALSREREAGLALRAAENACDKERRSIARLSIDSAVLENQQAIAELFGETGNYREKRAQLPRIEAERDGYRAALAERAQRLGHSPASLEAAQPGDAALARLSHAMAGARVAADALKALDERLADDRRTLERLEEEGPQVSVIDPRPWRERMAALAPDIAMLSERDERRLALSAERRRIEETARRLEPPVADLAAVAAARLPDTAWVIRQRGIRDAIAAELATLDRQLAQAEAEVDRLDGEIAEAAAGGALPTRAAITAARLARDEALAGLASVLTGRSPPLAADAAAQMVARYEALSAAADMLADGAVRDADRLAAHAACLAERARLEASIGQIRIGRARARAGAEAAEAEYAAPFRAAGLEPKDPDAMVEWLRQVSALIEARGRASVEADWIAAADAQEAGLAEALGSVAAGIGLVGQGPLPFAARVRAVSARLASIETQWDEGRSRQVALNECRRRIAALERDRTAAQAVNAEAHERLAADAAIIGLSGHVTPAEVEAALAVWRDVPGLRAEEQNRERRVQGMRRDIARFEAGVQARIAALAPDLGHLAAPDAIGALNERVQEARTVAAQHQTAQAALAEAEEMRTVRAAALEAARAEIGELLAGSVEPAGADALAARLMERDDLRGGLATCRRRLAEIAPEAAEADIRAELAGFDREAAALEREMLAAQEEQLDRQASELFAALSERQARRAALGTSTGAERAAFERKALEAEAVDLAREWAVLKLAASLVGSALDRQRAAHNDPLTARASAHFAALTGGSFAALSRQFDDADHATLVGVRGDGGIVPIAGMSDGTRDQLYLALRLAYLEDYAARNEPAPFIVDDLFQTFDDERTSAAIRLLGGASGSFQTIVFTHHASVVDLATAALGAAVDVIAL